MPIARRQIEELSRRFILEGLREGRHLPPSVLAARVRDFLGGRPDYGPVMRVRPQDRKRRWDLAAHNRVLEELDLDLEVLFAEMREISAKLMARHNFAEIAYHSQSRDLDLILGELSNLLFVTRNTNDRFHGVFDNFRDVSKIDAGLSTPGVVDLSESALVLPPGALSTRKVNLSHLHGATSWYVRVQAAGRIRSSATGTDAPFGNAFHDLVNVWRHDLVTDAPGPASVEFTIPVSRVETQEISITRIQLVPHSPRPMRGTVFHSTDNVNFLKIPQGSEVEMTRSDREYNIDTASTRIQYLRVVLAKSEPDAVNPDGTYSYSFGLKHLGLYSIGRAVSAEMVSKALFPAGMTDPITRVSLRASSTTPEQCSVRWEIRATDADGDDIGDWRPISPANAVVPELPQVLRFGNEAQETMRFTGQGATLWSTFRNASLYELAGSALPAGEISIDVVFGTAQLYRGLGAWSRNRRVEKGVRRIQDSYVSFDTGDRQNIWAARTDKASASTRRDAKLARDVTHLVVPHGIDYDPATMPLVPSGVDPALDPTPRYAIHSILWHRSEMEDTERLTFNLDGYVSGVPVSVKNVVLDGDDQPVVKSTDGLTTYRRNLDYTLFRLADRTVMVRPLKSGTPGSQSQFPASGSVTFDVTYHLDPDITPLVHRVEGGTIVMKEDLGQGADETFEVTYRFVPVGGFKIVKSTLRATARRGSDEGRIHREGTDYNVDVNRGTITRIASGAIQPDGENIAAYLDFYYEYESSLLETFTTWVFVADREPRRILYDAQVLDREAGERFLLRTQGDTIDLTESAETPPLGFGWHQFVVRSKDPGTHPVAAIRRIAALEDRSGNPVFVAGGTYFSRMMASRVPMKQVEQDFLLTNVVPANHSNFALTSAGEVVVNFLPGTTDDLYTAAPRIGPGGSVTFATRAEEFELAYARRIEDAEPVRGVRVRALLSRNASADGALTPKVQSYDVKVG